MPKRNPTSPWNPGNAINISPKDYEKQVVEWLKVAGGTLESFEVEHLTHLSGPGGDYEFDAVANFTVLNGAKIIILVECKRYSSPVEREKILALWAKMQDVKAHKAMMFATCGFQSGALEYAKIYGIAAIAFVEGTFTYETRSASQSKAPPPWVNLPNFAGIFMTHDEDTIQCNVIDSKNIDTLKNWLRQ